MEGARKGEETVGGVEEGLAFRETNEQSAPMTHYKYMHNAGFPLFCHL